MTVCGDRLWCRPSFLRIWFAGNKVLKSCAQQNKLLHCKKGVFQPSLANRKASQLKSRFGCANVLQFSREDICFMRTFLKDIRDQDVGESLRTLDPVSHVRCLIDFSGSFTGELIIGATQNISNNEF